MMSCAVISYGNVLCKLLQSYVYVKLVINEYALYMLKQRMCTSAFMLAKTSRCDKDINYCIEVKYIEIIFFSKQKHILG